MSKNGGIIIKLSDERASTAAKNGNVFGLRKVKFAEIFKKSRKKYLTNRTISDII